MLEETEKGFCFTGRFYARPVYPGVTFYDLEYEPTADDLISDLLHRLTGHSYDMYDTLKVTVEVDSITGREEPPLTAP